MGKKHRRMPLDWYIEESPYKLKYILKQIGLPYYSYNRRLRGEIQFQAKEKVAFAKFFGVPVEAISFRPRSSRWKRGD